MCKMLRYLMSWWSQVASEVIDRCKYARKLRKQEISDVFVGCSKCGKTSWGGCGRHVPGVYNAIADKDKSLCLCKGWPGVELPPHLAAQVPEGATSSSCLVM